jgi:hypothetical protein
MKNQKPSNSLVMTWLKQEHPDVETTGEPVQSVDPQTSEQEDNSSREDAQPVSKRDV